MRFSCGIVPGPQCVERARLAEKLGYERVWLYDSVALYEDIWIWLGQIAANTEIGLGSAVLVPHARHVMTTASAIATMEELAPGRMAYAFGTGATARWVLGKKPLTLAYVRRYMETLRALLRGEVVEIDSARTQMLHHAGLAPQRPIEVPLLLGANGPKGQAMAREMADGLMSIGGGVDGWDWHVQVVSGTVLNDGEKIDDERVKAAVAPWYTVIYHGMWEADPTAVDVMPEGLQWRENIERERPEGERHLAVHEGHVTHSTERDRAIIEAAGDGLGMLSWIGQGADLRARSDAAAAGGVTELLYCPSGPDVERELETFAAAMNTRGDA